METLVLETALGHTALASKNNRLLGLVFGHASERSALKALGRSLALSNSEQATAFAELDYAYPGYNDLVDRIFAYAAGEVVDFDDLLIDTSHLTPFGKKVTSACRRIRRGETATYGELAKRAGRPGAARAVGSTMARNRVPLVVPCHRVVPASGGLGGFSSPQGVAMKQRLLDMEQAASPLVST